MFAHRAVDEHEVLQKILVTEPERLLPLLTTEQHRAARVHHRVPAPVPRAGGRRAGASRPDLDLDAAADFVARMLLSLMASPGSVDLTDPEQVRELVRNELLAGILVDRAVPEI